VQSASPGHLIDLVFQKSLRVSVHFGFSLEPVVCPHTVPTSFLRLPALCLIRHFFCEMPPLFPPVHLPLQLRVSSVPLKDFGHFAMVPSLSRNNGWVLFLFSAALVVRIKSRFICVRRAYVFLVGDVCRVPPKNLRLYPVCGLFFSPWLAMAL